MSEKQNLVKEDRKESASCPDILNDRQGTSETSHCLLLERSQSLDLDSVASKSPKSFEKSVLQWKYEKTNHDPKQEVHDNSGKTVDISKSKDLTCESNKCMIV